MGRFYAGIMTEDARFNPSTDRLGWLASIASGGVSLVQGTGRKHVARHSSTGGALTRRPFGFGAPLMRPSETVQMPMRGSGFPNCRSGGDRPSVASASDE
jgi:hypothetical protein